MKLIPNAVSVRLARQVLVAQRNAPSLLFSAGVAGMVGSTVLACRATLKLQETLEVADQDLNIADQVAEAKPEDYPPIEKKKDTALVYLRVTGNVVMLYAPSLLLGAASIAALTKSHGILNERNVALTAAYAALDQGFRQYRGRVVEKYGENQDREFRYETEEVGIVDAKGKSVMVTRAAPGAESIYARFFDQTNRNWGKDPEINLIYIRNQQNYANDLLNARGHVFLNEVYESLGMEHSGAGAVVGWVRGAGDSYIDFGVFDDTNSVRDFVNGREGSILLDFNVDGVIYDKIDNIERGTRWQS